MKFLPTIGLEVHAQLATRSKLFCGCSTNSFGAEPNHYTCPVCLGLPGVLPVANRRAIEFVIKTALALGCEIPGASRFARKNYYYPDLPKAYQISQYELPLGRNGRIEVTVNGERKTIRIHRVHLEEDAGKLIHTGGGSLVDYNRTGIPLMEIVTEADITSGEEAVAYLTALRTTLQYLGVCEANMERGDMRCEPNISIRPADAAELGTKTELKNLNSFRAVLRGIEFEIVRQRDVLNGGGRVVQETRRWDEARQATASMRSKEEAQDYRYFPDPDLVPIEIAEAWLERLRSEIPELPEAKKARFMSAHKLSEYDADVLTTAPMVAEITEDYIKNQKHADPKAASNRVQNELFAVLNEKRLAMGDPPMTTNATMTMYWKENPDLPKYFASIDDFQKDGTISGRMAKDVFHAMFDTTNKKSWAVRDPRAIVEEKGLRQVSDASELEAIIVRVIAENPGPAAEYRAGKQKAIGFLVGQVMKASGGKANPKIVNELLVKKLAP